MQRTLVLSVMLLLPAPGLAMAHQELRIDPRLIAEAAEVWSLIASPKNPIWNGWNAADTPILFYLPGKQDVLINHPKPPRGFVAYDGPLRFPAGNIVLRNDSTIIQWDGQNTSREIEGVNTLVVADALSNLRQQVAGLLEDPRPSAEKEKDLKFSQLATDPYHQLALVTHEAFHVFQARVAPDKSANEMLLLYYPVLSVDNNVGFAQEGAALAAALRAKDEKELRAAVVRWLALRKKRRSTLPPQAIEYENGVEFGEGLAKYTEYRLLQTLEGRTPGPEMWWVQGFHGYDDLSPQRSDLVDMMVRHMRGEVAVNNDPYGTAPLRMRLYFSGMAIGAILDRLSENWKTHIMQPGVSLTDLVATAAGAKKSELESALMSARQDRDYETLVAAKQKLAQDGRAVIDTMLARIEYGDGTGIIVDYSALDTPHVSLSFTPFGIAVVDENRTIFTQVPIQAGFADGTEVAQNQPMPLLHDKKSKLIRFRLSRELSAEEIGNMTDQNKAPHKLKIELPEVAVNSASATVQREGRNVRIVLAPARK